MTQAIQVVRTEYAEVQPLRELYRQEQNCQIIQDSILGRGLADPYLILQSGRIAGYGGVHNKYDPGRLMEFYVLPSVRASTLPLFRELIAVSGATEIQAQTNDRLLLMMLFDCAEAITSDTILFEDAFTTGLACPDGVLRRATPEDAAHVFDHKSEPVGDWVIETASGVVATGGGLDHYNPPYSDIYMEVHEPHRQCGYGSYLVQEVKRVCYERGKKPAARCGVSNTPSRRTLQKAGFLPCARVLVGTVKKEER